MEMVKGISRLFHTLDLTIQGVYDRIEKQQLDPQLSLKVKAVRDSCRDIVQYIESRIDPHG